MRIIILTFLCNAFFLVPLHSQPNWQAIKSGFMPVYDTLEYASPYLQPQAVGGWEDGIFMTRDGLYMYCFYSPLDMISFAGDIDTTKACEFPFLAPYWRGPAIGVDTSMVIPPCTGGWSHSDIIYASRSNISEPFSNWQPTDINEPLYYEGAPHMIAKNSDTLEIFVFERTTTSKDIYIMRNVPHNPTDTASKIDISSPSGAEDNPHIEKIGTNKYILMFDDTRDGVDDIKIYYSISNDGGYSWQPAREITSINSPKEDVMPHLWNDGKDWWLYYATSDPVITDGRLTIVRRKQITTDDWENWGPAEVIIAPGEIAGGVGQVMGVGEPTLTQWGDISFSVVYGDTNSTDTTDVLDSDPWFLPKKGSPLASYFPKREIIKVFPNPASEIVNIFNSNGNNLILTFFNAWGEKIEILKVNKKNTLLSLKNYPKGIYFIKITTKDSQLIGIKKLIHK